MAIGIFAGLAIFEAVKGLVGQRAAEKEAKAQGAATVAGAEQQQLILNLQETVAQDEIAIAREDLRRKSRGLRASAIAQGAQGTTAGQSVDIVLDDIKRQEGELSSAFAKRAESIEFDFAGRAAGLSASTTSTLNRIRSATPTRFETATGVATNILSNKLTFDAINRRSVS